MRPERTEPWVFIPVDHMTEEGMPSRRQARAFMEFKKRHPIMFQEGFELTMEIVNMAVDWYNEQDWAPKE